MHSSRVLEPTQRAALQLAQCEHRHPHQAARERELPVCLQLDVSQSVGPPDRFLSLQALLHGEKSGFYDCVLVEQPVSATCLPLLMMHTLCCLSTTSRASLPAAGNVS